ncbi:T9SS type A sorting domain-containing protein [Spirosoma sp. KCTC 42546]|uniref:T9SS type A sorting domain-containing protein n=1 Tax=Spirosoma sp. KCTC 42546 TaxID=2520506 RepID=UPI00143D27CB|nr:T9SS type A sorting domain-containing protein [Spirosoma sp. KCTC 42546]
MNSVNIVQPPYNGTCGGTAIQVPITTTGTYGADNVFTIQLIGGSATALTYQDLPTKGNAPTLEITLPDTILPGAYRLRVLASNPKTIGIASTYFYPQRKPTARIVERPLTVAPYESVTIPIQLFGSDITAYNPYRVTINDSLMLSKDKAASFVAYPGTKTTTYRVTKVENACGEGTTFGQQTVTVTPFGLQLTTIAPEAPCPAATVQIGFSANGTFDSGNRFTVQVTNEKGDYVDLPTKGDRSPLEITLPASIPEGWGNYIRLVSTSPALVSSPLGGLYSGRALSVYPTPSAILETDVKAIRFGETATLVVRLTGQNVQCTLSEGTQLEYKPGAYQPVTGQYEVVVKPSVSTTYTIRSATGACGPVKTTGTVRVEVTNGIIAGKLADERPCIDQTIRVPIQTNAQFTAQTTFQVQIGGISLPAVLQKDTVVATLTSQSLGVSPGLDGTYYVSSDVRVVTQNPAIVSTISPSRFAIGYVPVLANINLFTQLGADRWDVGYPSTLNKPEPIRIMVDAKSNLPITISVAEGSRQWRFPANQLPNSSDYPYAVFGDMPTQSTTYMLTEVSNKCGTRRFSDKSKQVVIKQAENRQILVDALPDRIFCAGESISIPFQTTGAIADSVRYRVTLYGYSIYGSNSVVPVVIGRALKSPITVVLPDVEASTYSLRIEAENVALTSRDVFLTIHKKPTASISPGSTEIIAGESATLSVGAKGGRPYTLLTADGDSYPVTAYDAGWPNLDGMVAIPVKPDKTTTYRLKSITNACGTTALSDERTITVVPYRLYITTPSNPGNYATTTLEQKVATCRNGLLSVPYATIGSVPADEVFDLQVSRGNSAPFETLSLTSTSNPLVGRLPDSFTANPYGNYQVRVVGRKTGIISQTSPFFRVFEPPTATIALKPGSSPVADPTVTILVSVTNADNFTTYGIRNYEPDYSGTYFDSVTDPNGTLYIMVPRHKTTYSLAFVRNGCGYGTVSGEATVSVRPTLNITTPTPGLQQLTCAGKTLAVAYNTTGDWSNGINVVAELVSADNSSRELSRTTAREETLSLTLPTDLLPGDYTLRLRSADPQLSTSVPLRIAAPVTAQLTGNLVINAGQKLVIKPVVSGTFPINYSLSNGSVGMWQTGAPVIELTPSQSGTYRLASASNVCGAGFVSGSLTISVNPTSSRFITTDRVSGRLCGGDTVLIDYTAAGIATSTLTVQLSDRNGDQYAPVPTIGQTSPLRAVLPMGLPTGINYRFRVTNSDPTVASSVMLSPVTILEKTTGSILGPPFTAPGKPANLTLSVTGSVPVSVTLGQDGSATRIWQVTEPVTIVSLPAGSLPATFRLLGVKNDCGPGLIQGTGIVRLELITAIEPTGLSIQVFPNPVSEDIFIENLPIVPLEIELWSTDGRLIRRKTYQPAKAASLPVHDLPVGMYFLRVNVNQTTLTYRLIKY